MQLNLERVEWKHCGLTNFMFSDVTHSLLLFFLEKYRNHYLKEKGCDLLISDRQHNATVQNTQSHLLCCAVMGYKSSF